MSMKIYSGFLLLSPMPSPDSATIGDQSITQFYIEAHRICTEAQFICNSLPNAEVPHQEKLPILTGPNVSRRLGA